MSTVTESRSNLQKLMSPARFAATRGVRPRERRSDRAPASISGYVYADMDWTGDMVSSEFGLAGVAVTLAGTDISGNSINLTMTTNANGRYSFTGLSAGSYTIRHETPALYYLDGASNVGSVDGFTEGVVNADGSIGQITLGAGDNGVNYNFGAVLIPGS